jgi:hypothetical protein
MNGIRTSKWALDMQLTLVAFKCRHHRALALLEKVTAIQGLWRRDTKLEVIQRVVELEEEAMGSKNQSSDLTYEEKTKYGLSISSRLLVRTYHSSIFDASMIRSANGCQRALD